MATIDCMSQEALSCDLEIRVRYAECDPWGNVHHGRYFEYFEAGRVELLRKRGMSYRECEARGVFFVVSRLECRFRAPARFEDLLTLTTTLTRSTRARVDHSYVLKRDGLILAEAATVLACVDKQGRIQPIPDWFPAAPQRPSRSVR
jgi:acyl-CoA thioester hydrolase